MRASAVVILSAALAGVPVAVHAAPPAAAAAGKETETPEKRAARAFVEGQAAFEAADFRRAAGLFEQAYQAKPHHAALWNAAKSWQRAGEDLTAANVLEHYLKEAPPDAPNRAEANAALAAIEKRVGRVQVQIVGVTDAKLDGAVCKEGMSFVAPGDHVFTADDGGKPVRKVVPVKGGEIVSVTLSPNPESKPEPKPDPIGPPKPRGLSPWFVVVGGALAAGGGALTVISGLDTLQKRDAFKNAAPTAQTQGLLDAGYDSQLRTNVALGVTIGLVVITAAVAILLVDWRGEPARPSTTARSGR